MTIRVKICGVRTQAAYQASVASGADWVGFNFYPPSPRFVTAVQAASLMAGAQPGPVPVGLFVDPTDADIEAVLHVAPLQLLQLYASAQRIQAVRDRFGLPVWRSLGIETRADLPAQPNAEAAFVVEPRAPAGASRPGGLALKLEWGLLAGWDPGIPWLLAGGLTPANVVEAITMSGARAVDVSSGVESAPGQKDEGLIADFIRAAKGALADRTGS